MIGRRSLLAALALPAALAGCGWEPLYADRETTQADAALKSIKVMQIPERVGQRLEIALRNSFNPSGEPAPIKYLLRVTLATGISDLGIQSTGLGTRGEVVVVATYQLIDAASNVAVQTSTIHSSESFDIQANGYSTVVAQEDGYIRATEEIRRELITRISLYLQTKAMAAS
jgi:LPS-assembly lipoprotein